MWGLSESDKDGNRLLVYNTGRSQYEIIVIGSYMHQ